MNRHVALDIGKTYKNRGGGEFRCHDRIDNDTYVMINVKSHWRFNAHSITMYEDGTIEWDYSSHGFFDC